MYAEGNNGNKPSTLTIGSGVTIKGGSGTISGYYGGDSVVFDGTLVANTPGGVVTLGGGGSGQSQQNYTAITASNGGTVKIPESLQVNGSAIVTVSPSSSLTVGGNLLGTHSEPRLYNPQGTVTLNGTGTAAAPELLEAMSADLGSGPAGFHQQLCLRHADPGQQHLRRNSSISRSILRAAPPRRFTRTRS